ncbi:hypothetical protein [Pseudonocardia sp. NPDC049154]|uniref:hypothetical protein n=1 Tax=Pseudonocardia sp. NPDC049154 TaxID=3155501 RepID=UPI0033E861BB
MTTSQLWPEGSRPEHDPVAEDMDLLTHQEAAARFFDEIEELRAEEEKLVGADGGADRARLQAVQSRVVALESAIDRIVARREPRY